eukprot:SAG31_NODE_13511_length_864_cov_1.284967_1_plen_54_part_10
MSAKVGALGPVFWGTPDGPPAAFEASSKRLKVLALAEMDNQTRSDVAQLLGHGV